MGSEVCIRDRCPGGAHRAREYVQLPTASADRPAEVQALPGVLECAVVGKKVRSSVFENELPWAFVVPQEKDDKSDEARSKELMRVVNQRVAGYKKIRGVTWVEKLPKKCVLSVALSHLTCSSSGKVLKRELIDRE